MPEGQRSHFSALTSFEKCIAGHGAHVRSTVAFGADATRSPATHVECFSHEARATSAWNVLSEHGSHFSAFFEAEKAPAGHGWQTRSTVALGCCTTRSPLAQVTCRRQNALPAAGWNSLVPHAKHVVRLLAFENDPAAHSLHVRSDVIVGRVVWYEPAAHKVCGRQKPFPASGW